MKGERKMNLPFQKLYFFMSLLAFLTFNVSCGGGNSSGGVGTAIQFKGGTNHKGATTGILQNLQLTPSNSDRVADRGKLLKTGTKANMCGIFALKSIQDIASVILIKSNINTEYEGGATPSEGVTALIKALGTISFAVDYRLTFTKENTSDLKIKIQPALGFGTDHSLFLSRSTTPCNTDGDLTPLVIKITEDGSGGTKAKGILLFEKGKAEEETEGKITLDGYNIKLGKPALTAGEIVDHLVRKFNGEIQDEEDESVNGEREDEFINSQLKKLPYVFASGNSRKECGDTFKESSACLILTRTFAGEAGNKSLPYKLDYKKAK